MNMTQTNYVGGESKAQNRKARKIKAKKDNNRHTSVELPSFDEAAIAHERQGRSDDGSSGTVFRSKEIASPANGADAPSFFPG